MIDEGLYVELDAYRCHVFLDFREIRVDDEGLLRRLEEELGGRGVDSVDLSLTELAHRDVLTPFAELVSAENLEALSELSSLDSAAGGESDTIGELLPFFEEMLAAVVLREGDGRDPDQVVRALRRDLERVALLGEDIESEGGVAHGRGWWATLLSWILTRHLGEIVDRKDPHGRVIGWFDEWLLGRVIERTIAELGPVEARRVVDTVRLLLVVEGLWATDGGAVDMASVLSTLTARDPGRAFLGINRWDEVLWYRAEAMSELAGWLRVVANLKTWDDPETVVTVEGALARMENAIVESRFRVIDLLELLAR